MNYDPEQANITLNENTSACPMESGGIKGGGTYSCF